MIIIWFKAHLQTMSLSCPNCSTAMTLNNRLGGEIDRCQKCKGMVRSWRMEKVANMQNRYEDEHYKKYHYGRGHDYYYYRSRKHKKGGFLGDLFDFG